MKAANPSDLRALLTAHGIRPRRTLGQNFLIDGNTRRLILAAAELDPGEPVLEIGPGAGALTEGLLGEGHPVVAVEKDRGLAALLRHRFEANPGLELIEGDALETDLGSILGRGVGTVVSNLPYASGTRILVRLLFAEPPPVRMVVTLQTEVALRVVAVPGTAAYGLLGLWARWRFEPALRRRISPTCFYPAPDVQSSLVRLDRRARPRVELLDVDHFRALTRWAFTQRRKQMQTLFRRLPESLGRLEGAGSEGLRGAGIPPEARPGDLGVEAWGALSNLLSEMPKTGFDNS